MKRFKWRGYNVRVGWQVKGAQKLTAVSLEGKSSYRVEHFDFKHDCKREFKRLAKWLRRNESLLTQQGA